MITNLAQNLLSVSSLSLELRPVAESCGRRVKEPKQAGRRAVVDVGPRLGGHHAALASPVQVTPILRYPRHLHPPHRRHAGLRDSRHSRDPFSIRLLTRLRKGASAAPSKLYIFLQFAGLL